MIKPSLSAFLNGVTQRQNLLNYLFVTLLASLFLLGIQVLFPSSVTEINGIILFASAHAFRGLYKAQLLTFSEGS